MRARLSWLLSAALLATATLQAADFWTRKKFQDWSAKEIRSLLTDSPWVRAVLVPVETAAGGGLAVSAAQKPQAGCAACEASGGGVSTVAVTAPELSRPVTLRVSWQSALPVKQALVRIRFGDEAGSAAAAAEALSREETAYIVGVSGVPRQWIPADPSALEKGAFLRIKGLPPRQPAEVRAAAEGEHVNLLLLFPKQQGGGRPIAVEDREVEVSLKFTTTGFSRKFKLKEMVYQGRLEL